MTAYTISDAAIVAATLLGPVLAVQAQKWIERATARKNRKDYIFRTLMATRAARVSQEHVQALNMIDLEYYGGGGRNKNVREAWNEYRNHLNTPHAPETLAIWSTDGDRLFTELLYRMATSVNYNFERAHIKSSAYSPVAFGNLERDQETIRTGLAALLSKKSALPIMTMPASPKDAVRQTKLEVLRKIAGNRAAVTDQPMPEQRNSFLQGLNEVMVVFADSEEVSTALVQYKAAIGTPNHNDRLTYLFKAICRDVGIDISAFNDSLFLQPFTQSPH